MTTRHVLTILLIGLLFDATFTWIGVMESGVEAEGNPIIRGLMRVIGPAPTLSIAVAMSFLIGAAAQGTTPRLGATVGIVGGLAHLGAGLSWIIP